MFATLGPDVIHRILERVIRGDLKSAYDDAEQWALRLMQEVRVISKHVPGSSVAHMEMRNEIRALTTQFGSPTFFITINSVDVYNPLVKFLAGNDIDINYLLPEQVLTYWDQALLVTQNPVIAAKFFNIYMKAFIKTLLGYDTTGMNLKGGALGLVKSYYGCVEAQGRGMLHCHMLVWIEGGLNPDEIKECVLTDDSFKKSLLEYLDSVISTCVPDDPDPLLTISLSSYDPCSI